MALGVGSALDWLRVGHCQWSLVESGLTLLEDVLFAHDVLVFTGNLMARDAVALSLAVKKNEGRLWFGLGVHCGR